MLSLIFAVSLTGALITFMALWRYGIIVAIIGAPIGASLLALIVAVFQTYKAKRQRPSASESNQAPYANSHKHLIDR